MQRQRSRTFQLTKRIVQVKEKALKVLSLIQLPVSYWQIEISNFDTDLKRLLKTGLEKSEQKSQSME